VQISDLIDDKLAPNFISPPLRTSADFQVLHAEDRLSPHFILPASGSRAAHTVCCPAFIHRLAAFLDGTPSPACDGPPMSSHWKVRLPNPYLMFA